MSTYIALGKWTTQGLQKVKDSPSRLDAGKKAFESLGVKLKDFYMLMGQYDMAVVIEAPDDTALAKALLTLGSAGNIQTETLRAFTETEYKSILSSLK
jgi:uncharacterized protein with GYD domain